jgi:uncharacterized membrane protein HdeD (DUF308 family)
MLFFKARNLIDQEKLKEFRQLSVITGLLVAVAGLLSIINPLAGSLSFVIFMGSLFLVTGIIQGVITFKAHQKSLGAWFKVLMIVVTGILLLIYPVAGVSAMALLFGAYFFVDAFSSFSMALDLKPLKGWGLALANGMLSFLLGVITLTGWPANSPFIVGIVVGVSFLMDGIVLIYLGLSAKD